MRDPAEGSRQQRPDQAWTANAAVARQLSKVSGDSRSGGLAGLICAGLLKSGRARRRVRYCGEKGGKDVSCALRARHKPPARSREAIKSRLWPGHLKISGFTTLTRGERARGQAKGRRAELQPPSWGLQSERPGNQRTRDNSLKWSLALGLPLVLSTVCEGAGGSPQR